MVSHQIGTVLKHALTTFSGKADLFRQNLKMLKYVLGKITPEDVNLDPLFLSDSLWQRPDKAPVSYIDIYEDKNITMGIFIIKPGSKLPLHNHPQMHGLIKVLFGKIKVTSYSLNTDKCKEISTNIPTNMPMNECSPDEAFNAEHSGDTMADSSSGVCDLEPEVRNLHEIESVGGPAAFLDILAPPYDTLTADNKVRRCSYYSVLKEIVPGIFQLKEIDSPEGYSTDTFPYTGPELLHVQQQSS